MLGLTVRRAPTLFKSHHPRQFLCLSARSFTNRIFNDPNLQLWSDGGKNINHSSVDNIGGWQTGDSTLLNCVELNSIKYQSLKGLKDVSEDRIKVTELSPNVLFIGVFDGHGGSFVVDFVNNNLPLYIKRILEQGKSSLTTALRKGFIDCDMSLAREMENGNEDLVLRSGSTATVALLRNGEELVIASVGDSRAILCSDGKAILLTNDHTPSCVDEKNRVLASGGSVELDGEMMPRVNGRLAMTRCFGNFDLKPYGVIAVPEIRTLQIDQDKDNFLALVTDGISAVMTTEEAVSVMKSCQDPQESVDMVTTCAAQFGSEDDNTAILLPFRSFGKETFAENEQDLNFRSTFRNVISKYV